MTWDEDDFPASMIYRGDCGPKWVQIGPASWSIPWKENCDHNVLAEIAFRRFGPHLIDAVGATAVRVDDEVQVTLLFNT
jgi:hypothetical protein